MIVYPGNIQGRSIKETGAKGCYIVDVDEAGRSTLQFHELDFVRWQVRDLSIEGLSNEAEWIQKVEQVIEDIRAELPELMSVVRFRLIGRGDVHKVLAEKGQQRICCLNSSAVRRLGLSVKITQGLSGRKGSL